MLHVLLAGVLLGAFVAAQVGPVSLLCIRTATRSGFRPAFAIGAGAATIDGVYAALGVVGAAALVQIDPVRISLGALGTAVLVWMGVRTLRDAWRIRLGGEQTIEVVDVPASYRTGVIATASNPLTIVSWAAIFGAASTASLMSSPSSATTLVAGVVIGSVAWFLVLAAGASRVGGRLGPRTLFAVDVTAGVGLLAFAGLLGVRTLRDA